MGGSSSKVDASGTGFSEQQVGALLALYSQLIVDGKTHQGGFDSLFGNTSLPEFPQLMKAYCDAHIVRSENPRQEFVSHMALLINGRTRDVILGLGTRTAALLLLKETDPEAGIAMVSTLLRALGGVNNASFPDFSGLPWSQVLHVLSRDLPVLETCLISLLKASIECRSPLSLVPIPVPGTLGVGVLPLLQLSAMDLAYAPGCDLLYSTADNGFSLNKLVQSALWYEGVLTLIIKSSSGAILGAIIGEGIKEKAEFYGTSSTYLYTLCPSFRTFRSSASSSEANFVYCNTKILRSTKYPAGLGFGGNTTEGFRLWLDLDLDRSYVTTSCFTFEEGEILPTESGVREPLRIAVIEMWGFGGRTARESKEKADFSERTRLENMRKVDKAAFLDDFSKSYLLSNTFGHREQLREDPN